MDNGKAMGPAKTAGILAISVFCVCAATLGYMVVGRGCNLRNFNFDGSWQFDCPKPPDTPPPPKPPAAKVAPGEYDWDYPYFEIRATSRSSSRSIRTARLRSRTSPVFSPCRA
jgi:hypothetical protein